MMLIALLTVMAVGVWAGDDQKPWDNGRLKVSDNQRYLMHENGTPFFWQGETGWLLPERLDRAEAEWYLQRCREEGYNVRPSTARASTATGIIWTISSDWPNRTASTSVWLPSGAVW